MTSRDFCYWLQGYFEIAQPTSLTSDQLEMIKNHLKMVFAYDLDKTVPAEVSEKLDQIHSTTVVPTLFPGGKSPGILDSVWKPGDTVPTTMRC